MGDVRNILLMHPPSQLFTLVQYCVIRWSAFNFSAMTYTFILKWTASPLIQKFRGYVLKDGRRLLGYRPYV